MFLSCFLDVFLLFFCGSGFVVCFVITDGYPCLFVVGFSGDRLFPFEHGQKATNLRSGPSPIVCKIWLRCNELAPLHRYDFLVEQDFSVSVVSSHNHVDPCLTKSIRLVVPYRIAT